MDQRRRPRWSLGGRRAPRVGAIAFVLAALVGFACGRPGLDHPGHGDGGPGGASAVGGQPGSGTGAPGAGGAPGDIPCHQITDEMACVNRQSACRADYCADFVRCANPDDPRLPCSVPPDAQPCSTTAPSGVTIYCLDPVPWCHPVYGAQPPPEVCPPPLVCSKPLGCGDNGTANCVASGTRCGGDPPSCAPGYLPSINSAGCYEGCVPVFYCGS